MDAISKYLDSAGNKLDYRRYGEVLFDILIAGGLLVPGGSISQDGEKPSTDCCIFNASEDMEAMHSHEQVNSKIWLSQVQAYRGHSLALANYVVKVCVHNIRTDFIRILQPWVGVEIVLD